MKLNSILVNAGLILRPIVKCILRTVGMGRLTAGLNQAYIMNDD
jgi:hypothetical protein